MTKLFIVDPALASHHGHHFAVTSTFTTAAEKVGVEVIWLVNRNFVIAEKDTGLPKKIELTFSQGTYDGHRKTNIKDVQIDERSIKKRCIQFAKDLLQHLPYSVDLYIRNSVNHLVNFAFSKRNIQLIRNKCKEIQSETETIAPEKEMYGALLKHQCKANDRVLFHTCDAETYRDVVAFFTKTVHVDKWDEMPTFHLSTPYDEKVMPHNKKVISADRSIQFLKTLGLIDCRIFIYAENELLARHLSDSWRVEVTPLYLPQQPFAEHESPNKPDVFNFCYLGAARTEKGFPFIVHAIAEYLSTENRQDIEFTIQISPQILGYTADIISAVTKIKSISDSRLTLIEDVQSPQQYQNTLLNADVLLLCYEKENYVVRSSGIVIEAVTNGKNVIATKGTFPLFFAEDAGEGVESVSDFIRAINKMADDKERYSRLALLRKNKFLESVTLNSFFENNGEKARSDNQKKTGVSENISQPALSPRLFKYKRLI